MMADLTIDVTKFSFDANGQVRTTDADELAKLKDIFDVSSISNPGDIFGHTVNNCGTTNNGCGNNGSCSEAFLGRDDLIITADDFLSRNNNLNRMILESKNAGLSELTLGVARVKVVSD